MKMLTLVASVLLLFILATAFLPAQTHASGWNYSKMSWYGLECGTRTASGVRLTKTSMTFAHRNMPFGTIVIFRYRGRTATAVCTDRGPFIKGRVFDLGPGTAKALRFDGVGVVAWKRVGFRTLKR